MKQKLLLALLALFTLGGSNLYAQEDITSQYLTNADLSTVDNGWTYYSDAFKYTDWKTDGDVPVVEFYSQWNSGASVSITQKDFKFSQTITLPAGDYRIAVNAFYRNGAGDGTNPDKAWIFAGEKKQNVAALTSAGVSAYTGSNDLYKAANAFSLGDFSNAFDFSLESETEIEVGFQGFFNTSLSWCILGPVKLYKYSLDDYLEDYRAKVAEAKALYDSKMNAEVLQALKNAVVEESTFTLSSQITEAIATLTAKINDANNSISVYSDINSAISNYTTKANALDDNGKSAYETSVSGIQTKYDNGTYVTLEEAEKELSTAFINAIKAQTTENSSWTDLIINPSFENNFNGWTNNGMDTQTNTSFNKEGEVYVEKWQPNGTFGVSQIISAMPAGVYKLTAKAKTRSISSAKFFAGGIDVATKIADEENTYSIEFACDADADITIGFEGTGTGAVNSWIALDDFHLTLVSAGLPDVTAVTGKMNVEVAAAQTAAIEAYNTNRTTANYNAAIAAIAAALASVDAYASAATAVAKAKAIKENHNLASAEAAATFAEAIANIENPYNDGSLADADAANAGTTLGTAVSGWRANANGAAVKYLNNGFSLNDFDQALYVNTWSTEGASDGSNFEVPFYEYWTDNANSLGEKTWTGSLTGIDNGLYKVSAWVRVRAKNETAVADATGITMEVNGGTAVDVTEGTQVGESQFQLATYEAEGLVKDGNLTVNFNIAADNNISWLSFQNVKYEKVRDLTPEEAIVPATAEDYAALNAAMEDKVLGFETGEYAPYNNVEGVAAIAAAKAIDQTVENSQEDVQAATAAITDAIWTANTKEVNAVYDGSFEADYSGQSGNINPTGWQRVKGAAADGWNVRLMNGTNAGLAATTSGKALFTKQSAYYGYANGYTMPLKANTIYKVTFVYGGWGDCKKDGYVSMAAPDGSAVELSATDLPVDATNADADVNAWKQYEATFTTGEAGDYVLGLRKKDNDTSGQSQYVYGDIVLVKATADDFKDQLKDELDKANDIDTEANVGEGAFQIPATAATALTSEITKAQSVYDDAAATVDDVRTAITDLQSAEETYSNAELNAPAEGQLFNIILTYSGWTYDNKAITFIANGRTDQGNYNIQYKEEANQNLAQAFTFTKVEGNNYKLSQIDADGNVRYITDGKTGYNSGDGSGIRTTTEADKAAAFKIIATSKEGVYNIWNNVKGQYIGSQDAGVYTVNSHIDFKLVETQKPSIIINTTAAGWGTTILPFAAQKPADVKVYTCAEMNGTDLVLTEVDALEANKPYVIEGAWNETLTGDAQGIALNYTEGLLTGTYKRIDAPNGSYVLQKHDDKVAFFQVDTSVAQPKVPANRAYLQVESEAKMFTFGGDATAISALDALLNGDAEIFNVSGVKQNSLQKGMNIIKMSDGTTRKVIVK